MEIVLVSRSALRASDCDRHAHGNAARRHAPRASSLSLQRSFRPQQHQRSTTRFVKCPASVSSAGRAAARPTRPRKESLCAARARAVRAGRWSWPTASRSTILSAAGFIGVVSREPPQQRRGFARRRVSSLRQRGARRRRQYLHAQSHARPFFCSKLLTGISKRLTPPFSLPVAKVAMGRKPRRRNIPHGRLHHR